MGKNYTDILGRFTHEDFADTDGGLVAGIVSTIALIDVFWRASWTFGLDNSMSMSLFSYGCFLIVAAKIWLWHR